MNQPISFSIILPTYNRPVLLEKAIRSVSAQDYSNWELIIIDDGTAEENRLDIKKISSNRMKYFYQENKGKGAARNLGLEKAKGEYICFLDDDDTYMESHLSTFAEAIQTHPSLSIFKTGLIGIENDQIFYKSNFYDKKNKVGLMHFLLANFWLQDICIRREVAQSNKFRNYRLWQDKFYLIPLAQKNEVHQILKRTVFLNEHEGRSVNQGYKHIDIIREQVQAVDDAFSEYQLQDEANRGRIVNNIVSTHFFHAMKYEGIFKSWRYGMQYLKINPTLSQFLTLIKYQLSFILKKGDTTF